MTTLQWERSSQKEKNPDYQIISLTRFVNDSFSSNIPSSPVSSRVGMFCKTNQQRIDRRRISGARVPKQSPVD